MWVVLVVVNILNHLFMACECGDCWHFLARIVQIPQADQRIVRSTDELSLSVRVPRESIAAYITMNTVFAKRNSIVFCCLPFFGVTDTPVLGAELVSLWSAGVLGHVKYIDVGRW